MTHNILLSAIIVGTLALAAFTFDNAEGAIFAKYDGVDGEAFNEHQEEGGWISLLSVDWDSKKSDAPAISRRRATPIVEDVVLGMNFDAAAPKIMEGLLTGKVFPSLTLEFERTIIVEDSEENGSEEIKVTYLIWELTNVQVTSFDFSDTGENGELPMLIVGNNFEEIKVTYMTFDEFGEPAGNVVLEYSKEKGL